MVPGQGNCSASTNARCDFMTALLAAILPHCRSVSGPIVAAPLESERVLGIDAAIGISTARGGHALGVAGELAIAGIAPYAPLQTVTIRYGLSRRRERY
jgi:hypothetical protein